jgi:hypothetical protein
MTAQDSGEGTAGWQPLHPILALQKIPQLPRSPRAMLLAHLQNPAFDLGARLMRTTTRRPTAWLQTGQPLRRITAQPLVSGLTTHAEILTQLRQHIATTGRENYESIDLFHWGYVLPGHLARYCNLSLRIMCYLSLRIEPLQVHMRR